MFNQSEQTLTPAFAIPEQPSRDIYTSERQIIFQRQGQFRQGIARLLSPNEELAQLLKPFVFLDYFDTNREPLPPFGFHPHSGIATLTFLQEGSFTYEDSSGAKGILEGGGVEWIQSGAGVWHRAQTYGQKPVRGFQLWLALQPEHELGIPYSHYYCASEIETIGPAKLLLGEYNGKTSGIRFGSSTNYLSVSLKKGEHWCYSPPADHPILWIAVSHGTVATPTALTVGEIAAFQPFTATVEFMAKTDTEFVLGSSVSHPHELIVGKNSVHTSQKSLVEGEKRIHQIGEQLRRENRR